MLGVTGTLAVAISLGVSGMLPITGMLVVTWVLTPLGTWTFIVTCAWDVMGAGAIDDAFSLSVRAVHGDGLIGHNGFAKLGVVAASVGISQPSGNGRGQAVSPVIKVWAAGVVFGSPPERGASQPVLHEPHVPQATNAGTGATSTQTRARPVVTTGTNQPPQ